MNELRGEQGERCALAKAAYEKAFLKWYETTFVPSKGLTKEMCCKEEFESYQKCAQDWMASKGLDKKVQKWEQRQVAD